MDIWFVAVVVAAVGLRWVVDLLVESYAPVRRDGRGELRSGEAGSSAGRNSEVESIIATWGRRS